MRARRCILPCILGLSATLAWFAPLAGHAQARKVTLATFTSAQATLGRGAYAANCAGCHGQTLSGGEFASALDGNAFSQNWGGKPLETLFNFVRTRMPPAKPGSLSPAATAQIVAYVIAVNGGRAGAADLPTESAALAALTIPRSPLAPTRPMMPLSPLAPPVRPVVLANPLDHFSSVSEALLEQPPESEWLLWRRTYDDQGFSPLRQIDRSNVADLRLVWAWSLPNGPDDATPLEHDGVIFVDSYGDNVQALNAATGDLLWQYSRALPLDAQASVKRNLALYQDRLLVPTSDAHLVALDVKTGALEWDTAVADYRKAWRVTGGPLVAQGRVMLGVVGQSPGGGSIVGVDFATGRKLWTFYTIARPGQFGGNSWNGLPLEKRSGASVWTAGSYDSALHLAYFGVAQTYDTGPLLHPSGKPGTTNDGLYTDSTLALDPNTGRLAWYFQHLPNDQWDLDWAFEQQLIDMPVAGTMRKLLVTSGKMAIYEGMDPASGHYVFSQDLGLQNVVKAIDPRTGAKTINPDVVVGDGKPHTICPHAGAGRSWIATSYDASTGVLYVPMNEACMDLIPTPAGRRPNLSSGVDWFIRPTADSDGKFGRLEAFSLWTRKPVWIERQRAPQTTCVLATSGGVVFAGSLDRYLRAYDAASGRILWQVRLNDVPTSCPISYSIAGKQYLAIVVGHGGPLTQTYPVLVPEIQNPPQPGAEIWVFALPDRATAAAGG